MAFTYTKDGISIWGTHKISYGTFTNGATDEGGDVNTGLNKILWFHITVKATTTAATLPVVNETFPLAGPNVTIVCEDGQDGYWVAGGN